MSNRMSVLSRRLELFAVGFSVATFSFFLIGLFASANAKDQLVFFCAGLFFGVPLRNLLFMAGAWLRVGDDPREACRGEEACRGDKIYRGDETRGSR